MPTPSKSTLLSPRKWSKSKSPKSPSRKPPNSARFARLNVENDHLHFRDFVAQATLEKVDEERKFLIEAAIVRVMKSRQTMTHASLIAEVIKQLSARFMPTPQAIKTRIDSLLEKEFLERQPGDRSVALFILSCFAIVFVVMGLFAGARTAIWPEKCECG